MIYPKGTHNNPRIFTIYILVGPNSLVGISSLYIEPLPVPSPHLLIYVQYDHQVCKLGSPFKWYGMDSSTSHKYFIATTIYHKSL